MKKIILIFTLVLIAVTVSVSVSYASAPDLSDSMLFQEILGIDSVDDIKYASIVFSNGAADINNEDLNEFLEVYMDFHYELATAPLTEFTADDKYYINLWTDEKNIGNSKHTIFISDIIYGTFGNDENGAYNGICYRPYVGNARNALFAASEKLRKEYETSLRPIDEYDGFYADKMPDYLNTADCSLWAESIIRQAAAKNLLPYELSSGYQNNISRHSFCSLAARMMAVKYDEYMESRKFSTIIYNIVVEKQLFTKFESVNYTDMEYVPDDIKFLTAAGIINGYETGEFMPDAGITREEAAVILTRIFDYYNIDTVPSDYLFTDNNEISDWAHDGVYSMLNMNIMNGVGSGNFDPKAGFTTEQAITAFFRIYNTI